MSLSPHRVMMGAGGGDRVSYALDGTGDNLTSPDHADWDVFGSSSQDYTLEAYVKHTDHVGTETYFSQREDATNQWNFVHIDGTGLSVTAETGGASIVTLSGGEITDLLWHHVALIKVTSAGPTVEWGLYLDGAQKAYVSDNSTDTYAQIISIGARSDGAEYFDGKMDEMRIIKSNPYSAAPNVGVTDTINVPPREHISDANTVLLIHCGEIKTGTTGSQATFTDSGNTGHTITEVGNAIEDRDTYKF